MPTRILEHGVLYMTRKKKEHRFMRFGELSRFCDGTLLYVYNGMQSRLLADQVPSRRIIDGKGKLLEAMRLIEKKLKEWLMYRRAEAAMQMRAQIIGEWEEYLQMSKFILNNLTIPSGKNDSRTFLNYVACDQGGEQSTHVGTTLKGTFHSKFRNQRTEDTNVEISEELIKMIGSLTFVGEPTGEPYQHLDAFEDICDLFKTKGEEVKLRLFPLTRNAKDWFKRLPPDSITTWEELKSAFLLRHFPNSKQGKESLERAWERYKDLFLKLPNHGFGEDEVISIFYAGLTNDSRLRSVKDARKLLDDLVAHHLDWSTNEEETEPTQVSKATTTQEELQFRCERCGYAHPTKFCTWQQIPPLPHPKPKEELIEQVLSQFMIGQGEINAEVDHRIQIFASHISGLRKDLDHILRIIKEVYPYLYINVEDRTEVFITTRGGKVVQGPSMPETDQIPNLQVVEPEVELPSNQADEVREEAVRPREPTPIPNPTRKNEAQYRKFIELIKQVNINVPLVDLIAGMPNYVKFIKELVSNKANLGTEGIAFLNAECSAILFDTPKKGDLGSFTIPCYFGKSISCGALANFGASINLMPLSFYKKLRLGDLKIT
ncbi:hypothetical protein OSB04_006539 [Centaurea solstitialis]|uniref:Retrotransposon gag domain-containing protein n=1 Tax=Centaurea solstitialis TaxID=347529 RepID=A0AA38WS27_9ASTR|nr:hypothetical protein OSB04_006539 [Centaurea solstitialis]